MVISINRVILSGVLRATPELQNRGTKKFCILELANKDYWRDGEGKMASKAFRVKVIVYGKLAENCAKFLAKGKTIMCEGKLVDNGAVQASSVVFLESENKRTVTEKEEDYIE